MSTEKAAYEDQEDIMMKEEVYGLEGQVEFGF